MTIIRIAICDDDFEFTQYLKKYIENYLKLKIIIDIYVSPFDLIDKISNFDVLFLDYELPYLDGLKVLEKIKNVQIIKIMISNHSYISFNTYQYNLFWFVRKSHLMHDLSLLIPSLQEKLENSKIRKFKIFTSNKYLTLSFKEINYIVTQSNYLNIHTNTETYKIRSSFSSILNQFENLLFIIPIYGVIINIDYIECIDFHNFTVHLKNKETFPISRSMKKGVVEIYAKYSTNT